VACSTYFGLQNVTRSQRCPLSPSNIVQWFLLLSFLLLLVKWILRLAMINWGTVY